MNQEVVKKQYRKSADIKSELRYALNKFNTFFNDKQPEKDKHVLWMKSKINDKVDELVRVNDELIYENQNLHACNEMLKKQNSESFFSKIF